MQQPRPGPYKLNHDLSVRTKAALYIWRDSLFNVLRQTSQLVRPVWTYQKLTHSRHPFYRHPNLLKAGPEQVVISGQKQVQLAALTLPAVRAGTAYVSLVTDVFL